MIQIEATKHCGQPTKHEAHPWVDFLIGYPAPRRECPGQNVDVSEQAECWQLYHVK